MIKHIVKDLAELKLLLAQHTFYLSRLAVSVKLYTTCLVQQDCTAQSWDVVWNTSSADNTFQGSWVAKQCFSIWSLLCSNWLPWLQQWELHLQETLCIQTWPARRNTAFLQDSFAIAELKLLNLQPGKIRFFPSQWNLKALVQASFILLSQFDALLSCFPMFFLYKHLILLGKVISLANWIKTSFGIH